MKIRLLLSAVLFLTLVGCMGEKKVAPKPALHEETEAADTEIEASLAKLSPEDRKIAAAQKYCAVATESKLGSMSTPVKVMVKDQPVFLCCKGCQKRALADPDKTLATVAKLKAKVSGDRPSP